VGKDFPKISELLINSITKTLNNHVSVNGSKVAYLIIAFSEPCIETIKNKLMLFERKALRKIFGSTKERDGTWRIKTSDELDKLIRHTNIMYYIKAQKLSWFGHLH
jgi:hypothetical protein